jgi:hypothetical protein
MNLSDKAKAFMTKHPALIGVVLGFRFYEHPSKGDESPLVMITPEGKVKLSDYWDVPTTEDLASDIGFDLVVN